MKKAGFAQNSLWIIAGQIIKMGISFVVSVLTTRFLGPSNYGLINYIQSYITFFTAIIGLGLNGVIIYELVNNKQDDGKILGTAITLRFFTGLLCAASFVPILIISKETSQSVREIAFLESIQLPFLCLDTIQYWFQFQLKSKYPVIAQTIAHLVTSAYKVFLLVTKKSVEWFAFALSLDVIVLAVCYLVLYRIHRKKRISFSFCIAKRIIRACAPFTLASIMTVIYGQMDKVMIKLLLKDEAQVGLYSVAITICTLISFIPSAIIESSRPLVMEAKGVDSKLYNKRFRQMVAGVFWICFVYSFLICLMADTVLFFLYGDEYMGANQCLRIAVWYTSFSFIGSAKSIWLICEKKNRYVFLFSALGAITNLILNLLMIPPLGIIGAAFATLITQVLVNFLFPGMIKGTRLYFTEVLKAILLREVDIKAFVSSIKLKIFKMMNNKRC